MSSTATTRASTPTPLRKRRFNWASLFGHDYFISFKLGTFDEGGAQSYASDLARRLRENDFSVFFSEEEAPLGEELDTTIARSLRRSRVLVVIANDGALTLSHWVRKEVESFCSARPRNAVAVVNVEQAIARLESAGGDVAWLEPHKRIFENESADAVREGIASPHVVAKLVTQRTFFSANTRLRWFLAVVTLTLSALAIAAIIAGVQARQRADDARAAQALAEQERAGAIWQRQSATAARMLDGRIAGGNLQAILQSLAALRHRNATESQSAVIASLMASPHMRRIIDLSTLGATPALGFSPDGARIAVGGENGSVLLLDAVTGEPQAPRLTGLPGAVWSLSFNGDGSRLVVSIVGAEPRPGDATARPATKADGALRVWNIGSGKVSRLEGHAGDVYSVAYSKASDLAASAGSDGTLRVWDAAKGAQLWQISCADAKVCSGQMITVAIDRDGFLVASGGEDAKLRLWDARSGALVRAMTGHTASIQFVEFSPDGRLLASASDDGTVRVWEVRSGRLLKQAGGHQDSVFGASISADGRMLATASRDGKVRLFWIEDARTTAATLVSEGELTGHLDPLLALSFSPSGESLASIAEDGTLRLWGSKSAGASAAQIDDARDPRAVAISQDGRLIASGGAEGSLALWAVPALEEPSVVTDAQATANGAHRGAVNALAFSPDGAALMSGGQDGAVRFWSTARLQPLGPAARLHTAPVRAVAWTTNERAFSGGDDGSVRVWDAKARTALGIIVRPEDPWAGASYAVRAVAATADGRYVASGGSDGLLRIWDATATTAATKPLAGHRSEILALALSGDGTLAATGGADGSVFLWTLVWSENRIAGAKFRARSREAVNGPVRSVAFSADGRLVASAGDDKLVRLWDTRDGVLVGLPFRGHENPVVSLAFSADDTLIVSAAHKRVLLWPGPRLWDRLLCRRLVRNMSLEQWRNWVSADAAYQCQCPELPVGGDLLSASSERCDAGHR